MCSLYRREHYRTLSHRRLCPFGRAGSNPYVGSPIQLVQCSKDYHTSTVRNRLNLIAAFTLEKMDSCPFLPAIHTRFQFQFAATLTARSRSHQGTLLCVFHRVKTQPVVFRSNHTRGDRHAVVRERSNFSQLCYRPAATTDRSSASPVP
jgi:hypothetical protein